MSRLPERPTVGQLREEHLRQSQVSAIYNELAGIYGQFGREKQKAALDPTLVSARLDDKLKEGIDTYLKYVAAAFEGVAGAPEHSAVFDVAFNHLQTQLNKGLVLNADQIQMLHNAIAQAESFDRTVTSFQQAKQYLDTYADWEKEHGAKWRAQQHASAVTPTQGSALTARVASATTVRGQSAVKPTVSSAGSKSPVGTAKTATAAPAGKPAPAPRASAAPASRESGNTDAEDKARYEEVRSVHNAGKLEKFFDSKLQEPGKYKEYMLTALSKVDPSKDYKLCNALVMICLQNSSKGHAQLTDKELDHISEIRPDMGPMMQALKRFRSKQPPQTVEQSTKSVRPSATPKSKTLLGIRRGGI